MRKNPRKPLLTGLWRWLLCLGTLMASTGPFAAACIPVRQCSDTIKCARKTEVCVAGKCITPNPEPRAELAPPDASPADQTNPDSLIPPEPTPEPRGETLAPEPSPETLQDTTPETPPDCQEGTSRPCYTGQSGCQKNDQGTYACEGVCKAGTELCVNGRWSGACQNQQLPALELPNSLDDDCDGTKDNLVDCLPSKPYLAQTTSDTYQRIAFYPRGLWFSESTNKAIRMWDVRQPTTPPTSHLNEQATGKALTSLAYIPGTPARVIYAMARESQFHVWDPLKNETKTHKTSAPILTATFSPSGYYYYATATKLKRWSPTGGILPGEGKFARSAKERIFKLAYQPAVGQSPPYLLFGHEFYDSKLQKDIQVINLWAPKTTNWTQITTKIMYEGLLLLKDFVPIPRTRNIMVAQLSAGLYTPEHNGNYKGTTFILTKGKNNIVSVSAHPGGRWVVFGTDFGDILFYDWRKKKIINSLKMPSKATVKALAVSPSGHYLAAITDKELQLWTCP